MVDHICVHTKPHLHNEIVIVHYQPVGQAINTSGCGLVVLYWHTHYYFFIFDLHGYYEMGVAILVGVAILYLLYTNKVLICY